MIHQLKSSVADLLIRTLPNFLTDSQVSEVRSPFKGLGGDLELETLLEVPREYSHGHVAFPVFQLAKFLKKSPQVLAEELSKAIEIDKAIITSVQAMGGFLNFSFDKAYLQNCLFGTLKQQLSGSNWLPVFEDSLMGSKKVLVEYSSPNVAKPMHVGHFRTTIIGEAIKNLALSQGCKVIGVNHLGDYGSQFGRLAWAYKEWHQEYDFSTAPIQQLNKLYVRFHEELKSRPELEALGAATFKKLEEGDTEIRQIWQLIVDYSLKDYFRIYELLGVRFDHILGESFYSDKLADVLERVRKKGLLKESEGAQVVFFDESEKMPPCIVQKSDGASIYATRDLAAAIYRHEHQHPDQMIYVVGQEQALHFKQVFRVLDLMGYEWAKDCHHVSFGLYRFKDGKMSTRQGKVILLEDMVDMAVELVRKMVSEKNPDLMTKNPKNGEEIVRKIALGALIFNDLVNDRTKNVDFDWDRALSMDGDSGPYVQYTTVRCKSLKRKFGKEVSFENIKTMETEEEQKLIFSLMKFPHVLKQAYHNFRPNILAQYLLDVCLDFSHFYHKNRVLGERDEVSAARIALVGATEFVLEKGLAVLNINVPEEM